MTAHSLAENCVGGTRRRVGILVDKRDLEIPLKNKCKANPIISLHLTLEVCLPKQIAVSIIDLVMALGTKLN